MKNCQVAQIELTTDNKHIILDTYQSIMLDLSSFWDFWISSSFCKPETPLITYHCMFHVLLPLIFWHLMLSGLEPTSGVLWISVTYTQTKTNTDIQTFETNQMLRISVMLEDFWSSLSFVEEMKDNNILIATSPSIFHCHSANLTSSIHFQTQSAHPSKQH